MWILSNFAAGEGGVSLLHHVGSFFASVSFACKNSSGSHTKVRPIDLIGNDTNWDVERLEVKLSFKLLA